MEFDDIIVGAGSSGAVLAARLSEDEGRKVLLLEAGPDYASLEATPRDLLGPDPSLRDHDWDLRALSSGDRNIPFPRGKAVGGCSAVNGGVALRGVPADYDEWAALGNPEWAWREVLPYFKRLESDELGESALHGARGPIPIRRFKLAECCDTQRAAYRAYRALGFADVADHNEPAATGVGPIPLNLRDNIRISTALGYLLAARTRPNLTIRGNCRVERVVIEDQRAIGVEVSASSGAQTIRARRVTLCAGAIHSPVILMHSGLGPRADVQRLGRDCVVDLPGVGARLLDHPGVGIHAVPRAGAQGDTDPNHQMMVRYTVPGSEQFNDMQLYLFGRITLMGTRLRQSMGADRTYLAACSLMRPRSVGRLIVGSADPSAAPQVELNFCNDAQDVRRLIQALRLCWDALHTAPLAERVERIPFWTEELLASDERLGAAIRSAIGTSYHPVCTAPMGPDGDEGAVVDAHGRVRGVARLRVVDASIMPSIPRANTNLPCMMIAERIADWMRGEHQA
jgi:choline dehydrogenase